MELYRTSHTTVHAHHVIESRLLDGTIKNINPDRITIQSSKFALVATPFGFEQAKIGDWIIMLGDRSLLVMEHNLFKLLYNKY